MKKYFPTLAIGKGHCQECDTQFYLLVKTDELPESEDYKIEISLR